MVQENLRYRMAATQKIVNAFEEKTGITVHLVGVAKAQLPQLIMSGAATGTLPDVIGATRSAQVWRMYDNGLLNTGIPTRIVDGLGRRTFDDA